MVLRSFVNIHLLFRIMDPLKRKYLILTKSDPLVHTQKKYTHMVLIYEIYNAPRSLHFPPPKLCK